MNGIIVVDKPKNYTSFDVIAILRKKLGQKKIGHMGTLDPMATGVLPILLGFSAKFQIFTSENEKEYIAEIVFGVVTDTWDIHGEEISRNNAGVTLDEFKSALQGFKGNIKQIPPMYSAIKIGGVKLCDMARKGKEIERKPRDVFIGEIEILDFDEDKQTAKIRVLCSKGTYIRSLCHEIGQVLGVGACMGELRRTLSNSFSIDESIDFEKLREMEKDKIISKYVLPTDALFKNNNSVFISPAQEKMFKNGVSLRLDRLSINEKIKDGEILKMYSGSGFVGIGKLDLSEKILKFLKFENQ